MDDRDQSGDGNLAGSTRGLDPLAGLPEALTLEEVEEVTRITKPTLRRLIDTGVIPAWRLGPRTTRVWREELRAVIEAGRISGGMQDDDEAGNGAGASGDGV